MWAFPPPALDALVVGSWEAWKASITALVPNEVAEALGSQWERLQVYAMDSQVCRRRVGGEWVRCKNVGVGLTVLHRPAADRWIQSAR